MSNGTGDGTGSAMGSSFPNLFASYTRDPPGYLEDAVPTSRVDSPAPPSEEDRWLDLGDISNDIYLLKNSIRRAFDEVNEKLRILTNINEAITKQLAALTTPIPPRSIWDPANGTSALGPVQAHLQTLNLVESISS